MSRFNSLSVLKEKYAQRSCDTESSRVRIDAPDAGLRKAVREMKRSFYEVLAYYVIIHCTP